MEYDPSLGTFLSLDPLETANRYGYVEGNPINLVDLLGLYSKTPEDFVGSCQVAPTSACVVEGQMGVHSQDQWIIDQTFCKRTSYLPYPTGFDINTNKSTIASEILHRYGITIMSPNTWNYDDLARVGRGIWLIGKALETVKGGKWGDDIIKSTFGQWGTKIQSNARVQCNLAKFPKITKTTSCVLPEGTGGDGKTVYLAPGTDTETFIHEMGHVFDFLNGSTYTPDTLEDTTNPSTALMNTTGGRYKGTCARLAGVYDTIGYAKWVLLPPTMISEAIVERIIPDNTRAGDIVEKYFDIVNYHVGDPWGLCIASQLIDDYQEAGQTTWYGGKNHFEDFADTWESWVRYKSQDYHNLGVGLDPISPSRRVMLESIIRSLLP